MYAWVRVSRVMKKLHDMRICIFEVYCHWKVVKNRDLNPSQASKISEATQKLYEVYWSNFCEYNMDRDIQII